MSVTLHMLVSFMDCYGQPRIRLHDQLEEILDLGEVHSLVVIGLQYFCLFQSTLDKHSYIKKELKERLYASLHKNVLQFKATHPNDDNSVGDQLAKVRGIARKYLT